MKDSKRSKLKIFLMSEKGKQCVVVMSVVILLFYFLKIAHRLPNGDDFNFVEQSSGCTLFEWIYVRFMTRSGRIAAEAFIWIFARIPEIFWKMVTLLMAAFMGIYLYKWAILFGNKNSFSLAFFCAVAPWLMNLGAFVDGTLWVTGSLNYMYIAVPGIIGMYYVVRELFDKNMRCGFITKIISFFLIMITVSSSEQMGAVIIVLLLFLNIWKIKNGKFDFYPNFLMISSILLYVLDVFYAPGVKIRKETSIQNRLPDFLTVAVEMRTEYSIRWIMDALVNHMGLLFNIIWLLIIILLFNKKEKNLFDKCIMVILCMAEVLTIFKEKLFFLFEFEAVWGLQSFSKITYFSMPFWFFILFITMCGLYRIGDSLKVKVTAVLLLLAVFCTTIMMIFSPTMYASGCRVMYHGSLLMIIIILLLTSQIKEKSINIKKINISKSNITLWLMIICSAYQYIKLYSLFQLGFTIHLPW